MKKILLSVLLLFLAGIETMNAQPGMVVWKNGQPVGYRISDVDRVEFLDNVSEYLEREYVDLGLPSGTLWATMNVGAENPEESGDYFAWGETETKASFWWDTYTWMTAGQEDWKYINKYTFADNQKDGCWYSNGEFVGDGKKNLSGADDAAAKNWGSQWQMPTQAQFEELINTAYTASEFTTQNGVNGLKVTGKNGNSIFLPAVGFRLATDSYVAGSAGYYWSRSVGPNSSDYASFLIFNSSGMVMDSNSRIMGLCIRPVRKTHEYVDLGLPSGTLWATCNIGAEEPEEYGDYFAWGETKPKHEHVLRRRGPGYLYIKKVQWRWRPDPFARGRCRDSKLGQRLADARPSAIPRAGQLHYDDPNDTERRERPLGYGYERQQHLSACSRLV